MGLIIKRNFYGTKTKNYFKIQDIKLVIANPISNKLKNQNWYWQVFFKLYVNKKARDIVKLRKYIKKDKIKIDKTNVALNNYLSSTQMIENSQLGDMNISIIKQVFDRNNIPFTLKGKTKDEIYSIFYNRAMELGNFFGAEIQEDLESDLESEKDFLLRMKKKIKNITKTKLRRNKLHGNNSKKRL